MKQRTILCNLFDHKAKTWGFVQTHPNLISAERMLKEMMVSGQGNIAKYPEDFSLYAIAELDIQGDSGLPQPYDKPQLIVHAKELDKSAPIQS